MSKKTKIILSLIIGLWITSLIYSNKNPYIERTISSSPSTVHQFEYKLKGDKFTFTVDGVESKEQAFKKASKECFQYYTKGVYPGEERGLDIIDACANPIKGLR